MPTSRLPGSWTPPVAARQSGLFTVRQALEAGASVGTARARRRSGRWQRVAGDAFALSGRPVSTALRVQAAGLTWPDAVVCLAAAAVVHHLPVPEPRWIDVVVDHRTATRRGLRTHEVDLDPREVITIGIARVTALDRTIADCLGRLPAAESERLLAWVATRGLLDADGLARTVSERVGTWGNAQRRTALALLSDGAVNGAEARLHDVLRRHGIDGWRANAAVHDTRGWVIARADVLFERERLVVELDGREAHGEDPFQADRDRHNALVSAGWTVLRFTWHDITSAERSTVARITATLTASRNRPAPS